jgi:hypothetical protein
VGVAGLRPTWAGTEAGVISCRRYESKIVGQRTFDSRSAAVPIVNVSPLCGTGVSMAWGDIGWLAERGYEKLYERGENHLEA